MKNEKRNGYHKTEVGWIPKDWDYTDLGSVSINGGKYGAAAPSIDYSPDLPRYIRITDITDDGRLSSIDIKSIRNEDAKGYLLEKGDFLFARTGATVGKTYLHNKTGNFSFAGYLIRFVPDPKKLLGSYLSNFTQTEKYWSWVRSTIHTGTQPNINAQEYSGLYIPLPSIVEQKAIIHVLSTWDRAIELVQRLIEAKQRQKKGLMQGLLTGRLRFPEFGEPSSGEVIPENWKYFRLSQIVEIINGGTPSRNVPGYWNGNIPWIAVGDFSEVDRYIFDTKEKITELGLRESSTNLLHAGEMIISARGTVGAIAQLTKSMAFNQTSYGLRANPLLVLNDFLFYLLRQFNYKITEISHGAIFDTITRDTFDYIELSLPSIKEQRKIADVLGKIDIQIEMTKKTLEKLKKQKKGLMQKLLTGEIRVRVD